MGKSYKVRDSGTRHDAKNWYETQKVMDMKKASILPLDKEVDETPFKSHSKYLNKLQKPTPDPQKFTKSLEDLTSKNYGKSFIPNQSSSVLKQPDL